MKEVIVNYPSNSIQEVFRYIKKQRAFIFGSLIIAAICFAFWGNFAGGFELVDDHRIAWILYKPWNGLVEIFIHDYEWARFRPLYLVISWVEIIILRDNFTLWVATRILLAVLASYGFYYAARNFSGYLSATVAALFIPLGAYSEIWLRMEIQEAYGVLFVVIALIELANKEHIKCYAWLIAASLVKESFLPLFPIIFFINYILSGYEARYRLINNKWLITFIAMWIAVVLMVIVQIKISGHVYGSVIGVDSIGLKFIALLSDIRTKLTLISSILVALFLAFIRRIEWRIVALIILGSLSLLLSQAIIYAGSPEFGRYLMPAGLVVPMLLVTICWGLKFSPSYGKFISNFISVLTLIYLSGDYIAMAEIYSPGNATRTKQVSDRIEALVSDVKSSKSSVFILARHPYQAEQVISLSRYLQPTMDKGNRQLCIDSKINRKIYRKDPYLSRLVSSLKQVSTPINQQKNCLLSPCILISFGSPVRNDDMAPNCERRVW